MGAASFEVFVGTNNLFQFRLMGPDGQQVLISQGFANRDDCMGLIRLIKEAAPTPERYERKSEDGKLFFRLKAANHRLLATSAHYAKEEERDAAMAVVRKAVEAAVMSR